MDCMDGPRRHGILYLHVCAFTSVIQSDIMSGQRTCPDCLGRRLKRCPICEGKQRSPGSSGISITDCKGCSGTGQIACAPCDGVGRVPSPAPATASA